MTDLGERAQRLADVGGSGVAARIDASPTEQELAEFAHGLAEGRALGREEGVKILGDRKALGEWLTEKLLPLEADLPDGTRRLFLADAVLALRDALYEAPPEFCDVCPHALYAHNPDGSCGCGMDCAAERKRRAALKSVLREGA